jgi:hypothetical protein
MVGMITFPFSTAARASRETTRPAEIIRHSKDIEFDGGQVDKFFAGRTCRDRDFSPTPPDPIMVSSDNSLLSVRLKTALIRASNSPGANGFGR